jgi:peptidyl-prolyl cis-trans isomerase B (cyclophilin B)
MDARRRRLLVMGVFILVVSVVLWGGGSTCSVGAPTANGDAQKGEEWVNSTAHIDTDRGRIVVELADRGAPLTVGNFMELADAMFYDNMKWHRIVDDFVIQTGDPNSRDNNLYNDGTGGSTKTIPLETNDSLTHEDGAIGMARSTEPDSASSQFYICDGAQHGLDGDYAVFGHVVEGMDVVRSIASVPVYGNTRPLLSQHPVEDVWLYSVRIMHGFWNVTDDLPDGPTESTVGGSGIVGLASGLVYAAIVAPLVLVPVAFVTFRRSRRRRPG